MNAYAQQMINALNQVGQPIVTKQTGTTSGTTTTTADQNVPLDLSTIMAMIMMMMQNKKGVATSEVVPTYAPPATDMRDFPLPAGNLGGETAGYPGAGGGNPSEALANALAGIATAGYVNRSPNLVMPGTQLPTGTNPLANLTPADIIKLMLG